MFTSQMKKQVLLLLPDQYGQRHPKLKYTIFLFTQLPQN